MPLKNYSFRIGRSLHEQIETRRFPGETRSAVVVRLLSAAKEAIESRYIDPKEHQSSGEAPVEVVEVRMSEELSQFAAQYTFATLLEIACNLPVVTPLANADEVLKYLRSIYPENIELPLAEVILRLRWKVSMKQARQFLLELKNKGQVSLMFPRANQQGVMFGSLYYGAITITVESRLNFTSARKLLHRKDTTDLWEVLKNPSVLTIDRQVVGVFSETAPRGIKRFREIDTRCTFPEFSKEFQVACQELGAKSRKNKAEADPQDAIAFKLRDGKTIWLINPRFGKKNKKVA